MVIDHVDDALHALSVDRADKALEVRHAAELGVDLAVVAYRVGRAESTLPRLPADRVDRHEPDDIRAEGFYLVKAALNRGEGAFVAEIADEYLIHHLISQCFLC